MVTGLPLSEQNLILTGYSEPNKPRIALQLSERLRLRYVDVNQRIEERIGESPDMIRDVFGERRLKAVEAEIMEEVLLYRNALIRIEGTTLLHSNHHQRLRQSGQVICLIAQLGALLRQMHLSMGARYHDPQERAFGIGELQREWRIRDLPDIHLIDTTYKNETSIIEEIIILWTQISLSRG